MGPRVGVWVWVAAVMGFFLVTAAWAFADPILSGPDEPAHLIRAEAIVRGQLIGTSVYSQAGNPNTSVLVPGFLQGSNGLPYWCFIFNPNTTATCAPPLVGPDHLIRLPTYVGHYPPLYYAVVGLPSLADPGKSGVYWMRLLSALVNALLLGSAVWLALRRSRLLAVAVLVAATPTVIYYAGSVNPNGMEMTSAVCFWCAVGLLTMPWPGAVQRAELSLAAVSGALLALSRGLSPVWVVIAVVAALSAGDRVRMRALARRRDARIAAAALLVATAAAAAWIVLAHGLEELGFPNHESYGWLFTHALSATPHYLSEMVGYFGANNIPAPPFATTAILVAFFVLVAGALILGNWRERAVLTVLLIAIVAVPIAVDVATGRHYGLIWQGRYTMAVGVGSPIFAGHVLTSALSRRRATLAALTVRAGWIALLAGACVGLAQFTSFLWDLRRFMVGANGPMSGVFGGSWQPPVDGFVLLIAAFAGLGIVTVLLTRSSAEGFPLQGEAVSTLPDGEGG